MYSSLWRFVSKLFPNSLGQMIFLRYYNKVPNVGDHLNVNLIESLSGKRVVSPWFCDRVPHLLAVGSVLGQMNSHSVVWGSGLISAESVNEIDELGDIRALRGRLTKDLVEKRFDVDLGELPLGDPALLMPNFFGASKQKKFKFGLVPHYVDKTNEICSLVKEMGGHVIDVGLPEEIFIQELTSCEVVLSSSLHGLIICDAYGIPNKRVVLGDGIFGGDFKFLDYYSTMLSGDGEPFSLIEGGSEKLLKDALKLVTIKKVNIDLGVLESSFPESFE